MRRPGEKFINVDMRTVAGDYFNAMEIPLVRGRFFTDQDTRDTPSSWSWTSGWRSELWPGQDAVGKRIRTGGFDVRPDTPWMTVIGVTGRVRQYALDADEPRIAMYLLAPTAALARPERRHPLDAPDPIARRARRSGSRSGSSIPTCRSTTCGRWSSASTSRWRGGVSR